MLYNRHNNFPLKREKDTQQSINILFCGLFLKMNQKKEVRKAVKAENLIFIILFKS